LIGGWVVLPPAVYPLPPNTGFPFWIIGSSLPSDVLINKVWIAPFVTCLVSLLFEPARWRNTPLNLWDGCLGLFCLWPLLQEVIVSDASPAGWVSSLYLAGAFALPWWLGRIYLRTIEDVQGFALVFAVAMVLLVPIALLEGVSPIRVQTLLFGEHPFATDGVERYIGYRPQALFEHGNQFGLWCAAATVSAFWLARVRKRRFPVAWVLAGVTVASQSVGAIALMVLGSLALLWTGSFLILYRNSVWIFLSGVVAAGLLIAEMVPLREFIEQTGVGQALLDAIRSTGLGSFAWRVSQDLKAAPLLREHLLIGHGQWDWFFPLNTRPWGLPLLIIGQFGLIGLALLLTPIMLAVRNALLQAVSGNQAARLTCVLVIIAGIDAVLNSFLLWPFIVLASKFAGKGFEPSIQEHERAKSS
ncbi:MAG: hypothetical protein AAFQ13_03190, partial [Pseudomonadota bacterium]